MVSSLTTIKDFLSGGKSSVDSKPPAFLAFRSSGGFIIATVLIAIFTDILLYGIIVPVIPFSLTNQVGVPESSLQTWNAALLACYTITLFIGSPIFGAYADHTSSRRWPLLLGLMALAGSTLLLCLGTHIALLIVGRLLQGLSAAMVWSVGLALLADTMGDKIGMAMGYVSIAMSVGLLVSPAIGGAVFAGAGYYAVYYVAFGCIFLDVMLRLLMVEKKVASQWLATEEQNEAVSVTVHIGADHAMHDDLQQAQGGSSFRLTHAGASRHPPDDHAVQPHTLQGRVRQAVTRYPKLRLLKSRRNLAANFGIVIQACIMFAFDTVLPLFVKATFNWSSTAAGLIFFCLFIPGFIAPLVGHLCDKYGPRWPSAAGFLISVPVLVCLRFVTQNTLGDKVLLGALLALVGASLCMSGTPLMAEITYAVEAEEAKQPGVFGDKGAYGLAYGIFCLSFALGGTVGTLVTGYVMASEGWGTVTWVLAIWSFAGALVVAWGVGCASSDKSDRSSCVVSSRANSPTDAEKASSVI